MSLPSLPYLDRQPTGFVSSERSGCDVQVYNRSSLAISLSSLLEGGTVFDGHDGNPSLLSASCNNAIGAGGQFQVTCKAPPGFDPLKAFEANSWVDVSMRRFDRAWHTCRGLIDDCRFTEQPGNQRTFTILGRSFQKVWATTPVYFNNLAAENVGGAAILEAFGTDVVVGSPDNNVKAVLLNLLRYIGHVGRANWQLPPGLPGPGFTFADAVTLDTSGFEGLILERFATVAQSDFPEVDLWALASQYADLMYCEMFTELMPAGGYNQYRLDPTMASGLSPRDSRMTVVYRDRPFPRVSPASLGPIGRASPYFQLPTHRFRRVDVSSLDRGWSDQEAFNSFTVVGGLTQEQVGDLGQIQFPLWWPADMQRRGLRRMDASSMYEASGLLGDAEFATAQQSRLRDWYGMGGELQSGSIQLARGAPEVRVGSRVVIEASEAEEQLTFYVEAVSHEWSPMGLRTRLDVTRGYQGSDNDHLGRLASVAEQYVLGESAAADDLALVPIPRG